MKKIIIILILAAFAPTLTFAQNTYGVTKVKVVKEKDKQKNTENNVFFSTEQNHIIKQQKLSEKGIDFENVNNIDKWAKGRRWGFGVQIGTDIGGSIPIPFKYIPKPFNARPKLNISVGGRASWSYNNRWSLHVEATYKTVKMEADARVENQRFEQNEQTQYYSGTASMMMEYTMMEFPLYAKWALSKKYNDFLVFGFYYSLYLSPKFVTTATNGYIGGVADEVAGTITPDKPMIMDFTEYLGKHDYGVTLGYERRVWRRANIGIRLSVGFKDVMAAGNDFFDYKMLQMLGTINLEYDLLLLKGNSKK